MPAVVLSSRDKGNGTTEVTLSRDGVRFTAIVPTSMVGTENAAAMYEVMADRVTSENARLRRITAPGQREREA